MQRKEIATDDDMVALFIRSEVASIRWEPRLQHFAGKRGYDLDAAATAPASDIDAREARAMLLGDLRGYRRNVGLFEGFPEGMTWVWADFSLADLRSVRYLNVDPWNGDLSKGTRFPEVVVTASLPSDPRMHVDAIVEKLRAGVSTPPIIVVGLPDGTGLVVLEGHARLTAFFAALDAVQFPLRVLLGTAHDITTWKWY